jgi:hypothetical protein
VAGETTYDAAGGDEQPLGEAAVPALLGDHQEPVALERPQVVVELLARQAERWASAAAEAGSRSSARMRARRGSSATTARRVLDDLDGVHGPHPRIDKHSCQCGSRASSVPERSAVHARQVVRADPARREWSFEERELVERRVEVRPASVDARPTSVMPDPISVSVMSS